MLFAALGTLSYGTREIAQNRDNKEKASKLFWEIEILSIITSCISLIAWVGFIILSKENTLLYIALTPFLLSTLFDISWFFTGYENVKTIVVRNSAIPSDDKITLPPTNERTDAGQFLSLHRIRFW